MSTDDLVNVAKDLAIIGGSVYVAKETLKAFKIKQRRSKKYEKKKRNNWGNLW